jgi:hypothetical protein
MSSYLREMNLQVWCMVDIGLSHTLEDCPQTQGQKKCPRSFLVIILSISFLYENWTVRFDKSDDPIFPENSYIYLFDLILPK